MAEEQPKKPLRPRKKKHAHEHHGGAWKVAYADFVTAMMALFLVLWLVSQADQKLKNSIAQYFRSPGVFDTMQGGVLGGAKKVSKEPSPLTSKDEEQALFGVATALRKAFSTRPEFSKYKEQIKIEVTEEGLRIDILDKAERVSFPSGRADLTAEAQAILAEIAQGICDLPNPVMIGGHTDRHLFPAGSVYTNWELSADRANAARRALEASCLQSERVQRVIGYADTQLLVPTDPFSPANRRISIVVSRINSTAGETDNSTEDESGADEDERDESAEIEETTGEEIEEIVPLSREKVAAARRERRLVNAKLSGAGSTTVGEPDEVPSGKRIVRETPKEAATEGR